MGTRLRLDKSIVIRATPKEVYEWLAPARMPRWDPSLTRAAPRAGGGLAPGARFERVSRELGLRFAMDAEAVDAVEGRRFAWRQVAGDFETHEGAIDLEPTAEGTRVHLVADVELPYVLPRLATDAEVRRELSRELDEALFNLKALVERASSGR